MLLHMLIWCLKYFLLLWMLKTFVLLNIFLEAMIRFSIEIKHLYKLENLSNIINVFTVTFDQLNASLFSAHQRGVEALFDAWISDFSPTHIYTQCSTHFTLSCHDLDSWSRTTLTLPTKDHFMFLVKQIITLTFGDKRAFFRHFARHALKKKKVSVWYCISVLAGKPITWLCWLTAGRVHSLSGARSR